MALWERVPVVLNCNPSYPPHVGPQAVVHNPVLTNVRSPPHNVRPKWSLCAGLRRKRSPVALPQATGKHSNVAFTGPGNSYGHVVVYIPWRSHPWGCPCAGVLEGLEAWVPQRAGRHAQGLGRAWGTARLMPLALIECLSIGLNVCRDYSKSLPK